MSLFDETFDDENALLDALKERVETDSDGKFRVGGDLRDAFDGKGRNAVESKKYRERAQRAESERDSLKTSLDETQARLDELLALKPDEMQKRLTEFASEKARYERQLKELPELKDRVARYESAERTAKIKAALRERATALGVRSEALRDVERLAGLFAVDAEGGIVADDGSDVDAILANEIRQSPHWLPTTRGGGSTGASSTPISTVETERAAKYEEARKNRDVSAMIRYAPPAKPLNVSDARR